MMLYYNDLTLKEQLQQAKNVKDQTGMNMYEAHNKLKKLSDQEAHNEYASETNAEHGYLGYSVVGYYNNSKLYAELFPPQKVAVTYSDPFGTIDNDNDLPF